MIKKLKNQKLLLIGLIAIMGLFLPTKIVLAFTYLPQLIASAIITLALSLFVIISILWFGLTEWALRFVLSPDFISLSYTSNPFVMMGWTITRDFANMFFIVILVVIGLATALRIDAYKWQKNLPRLIIIALLINFTPIFLGMIIDASNIVMNFFVEGIAKEAFFSARLGSWFSTSMEILKNPNWIEAAIMPLTYIAFNFIAGVIYLLFAVLFMLRYVVLWMLIIISPIAFICYVLPGTKSFFKLWWQQFIQWCLVGAIGAFFIYLSDQFLFFVMTNRDFIANPNLEENAIMNNIFPYFIPVLFLLVGFVLSVQSAPAGTKAIFNAADQKMRQGKDLAERGVKFGARKATEKAVDKLKLGQKAQGFASRLEDSKGLAGSLGRGFSPEIKNWGQRQLDRKDNVTNTYSTLGQSQATGKTVQEIIQGYSNKEFNKKIEEKDIEKLGLDIVIGASLAQIKNYGKNASNKNKQAMRKFVNDKADHLLNEGIRLETIGKDTSRNRDERDKATNQMTELLDKMQYITESLNFIQRQ